MKLSEHFFCSNTLILIVYLALRLIVCTYAIQNYLILWRGMKVLLFFALFKSSIEALWELSFALSAVRKTSAVFFIDPDITEILHF